MESMDARELFNQTLIVESDLQDFAGHLLAVAHALGLSRLRLTAGLNPLFARLRERGAGRGQPLPVSVYLRDTTLAVQWGEPPETQDLASLPARPDPLRLETLAQRLRQATQVTEPARLLARNREIERRFEETRRNLREEIIAIQTSLEERQSELHESIRQAETDALTELFNRRAFDVQLEQAFRRARRQRDEALSLLLLDLDHFKEFNDEHGHQHGDTILQKMADAMRSAIRTDVDAAFRVGGDEFAIILWAGNELACRRAMTILEAMEGRVSIGITTLDERVAADDNPRDFFARTDAALYASKDAGRGCITTEQCQRGGRVGCRRFCAEARQPALEATAARA